ncbi:type I toxin-antitoxin system Ibs family toxin [Escherichia coli]|nr:type I toxin-antitoxin system Ibs family toxin [Escherichia coli]
MMRLAIILIVQLLISFPAY